ncbi:hypothetical protein GLOIN_2v1555828 [Rhizophagus irregularis DAOM 181602=DAOM 197198]|uniref:BHLH domain-containing protein n=1 Tax=Rhizophagus irregularis (strain DAOM 181602 / DAOM 197198 / MUCL 43194) TaxID=747089 RepID=A0A2P4QFI0_RHIID|nr:hypothetical protein GLOIN_2v1555828 [Rhizophagus irregularis DAOM 181602=DAOM 197198]POG76393.1 hypothetical protein GLOIN_2v1555828 [Rhizophagus irregularis DAOM 181602=DAOM 197198]|eukprot:XP_025183259.1 hypothetical protein GLOIN_2v1555828 [Rhizophagus irregularis DAOM 181602=DAOM 197198]
MFIKKAPQNQQKLFQRMKLKQLQQYRHQRKLKLSKKVPQPRSHPVLPSTPQQKQDPVTIHSNPLPIQPAPITPQHVQQQTQQTTPSGKPPVGSEEWHRQRRENHKEVERRRRDTINAGINELAKIVPGCEKNKGSILNRAVQYIQQLKENEAANIEKWTLEKLLTDQAIQELQTQVEMLKTENGRLRVELEELQGPSKKKQRTD